MKTVTAFVLKCKNGKVLQSQKAIVLQLLDGQKVNTRLRYTRNNNTVTAWKRQAFFYKKNMEEKKINNGTAITSVNSYDPCYIGNGQIVYSNRYNDNKLYLLDLKELDLDLKFNDQEQSELYFYTIGEKKFFEDF